MTYDLSAANARAPLLVVYACTVIAVITTVLRIRSKWLRKARVVTDDYLVVAALFLLFASLGLYNAGVVVGGIGRHAKSVQRKDIVKLLKIVVAVRPLYGIEVVLAKMSIMSFYFRLFGSLRSFRLSAYAISLIIILWGSTVVLETIFICMPFSKNWDMKQKGYCLHARELYIAIGAVNISTDILLMGLPVPYILCMRIDLRRKLGIIAMFSLGIFNTAVSILRMRAFLNAYNHDITFTMARVFLWTTMDPCVCIIVANLPMVRTYLMIVAPRVFGNTESAVNISNAIQNMRGINRIVVPPERSHLGYTRDWMRDHERREKPFGVEVVISGGRLGREEV